MGGKISERNKKLIENEKLYHKNDMRIRRENHKEANIEVNKVEKNITNKINYKNISNDRKYYHRKYNYGIEEPKIKDVKSYIADIKKYPAYFPKEEFNKRLDIILKDNPFEILGKKLKDTLYDILDKKGTLTPERIIRLYNDESWANAIGEFMSERNYSKNGDDTFVHT